MSKTQFESGSVVTSTYLNGAQVVYFDDQPDKDWHYNRLEDDSLSNKEGMIKTDLRLFLDGLTVSALGNGTTLTYTGGRVELVNGTVARINPGQLAVEANANSYLYINCTSFDPSKAITVATSLPNTGIVPLAYVVSINGVINSVERLNDRNIYRPTYNANVTNNAVPAGSIISFAGVNIPSGYLEADGRLLNVRDYPSLFSALGTSWGGDGVNTFRIPDLRSRIPVGAGQTPGLSNRAFASYGGQETVALNTSHLPSHNHSISGTDHSHSITDRAHNHYIVQGAHAHFIRDPGHAHGVTDPQHVHGVSDPGHAHSVSIGQGDSGGQFGLDRLDPTIIRTYNTSVSATGVGIHPANSNISIQGAGTGIYMDGAFSVIGQNGNGFTEGNGTGITSTNSGNLTNASIGFSGGGQGFNVMNPFVALRYLIKF